MRFEYNSNLVFEKRVKLVAKEIQDAYPFITDEEAKEAATLSIAIDDRHTNDDEFNRYYYILRTIGISNKYFLIVFSDAFKLYQKGLKDYNEVMQKLIDYKMGYSSEFPELV